MALRSGSRVRLLSNREEGRVQRAEIRTLRRQTRIEYELAMDAGWVATRVVESELLVLGRVERDALKD